MRLVHSRRDQLCDLVVIVFPVLTGRRGTVSLVPINDPPHRLVRRASDLCRTPVATHLSIGGQYVHPFPRVLQ